MPRRATTVVIDGLQELPLDRYDAIILDQYGVLHNGEALLDGVAAALERLQRDASWSCCRTRRSDERPSSRSCPVAASGASGSTTRSAAASAAGRRCATAAMRAPWCSAGATGTRQE